MVLAAFPQRHHILLDMETWRPKLHFTHRMWVHQAFISKQNDIIHPSLDEDGGFLVATEVMFPSPSRKVRSSQFFLPFIHAAFKQSNNLFSKLVEA